MKFSKAQLKNIPFIIVIAILVIPQTRQPIQVLLNKGLALFAPSVIDASKQDKLEDYDWTLSGLNPTSIFNFKAAKDNVVLVNFWATWCPPCIAEMPSLQELYNVYKDKIVFVFVSNEEAAVISTFLKKEGMTVPVYQSITSYPKPFNVKQIPRTFLIDKKGHIVIDKVGAANWSSKKITKIIDKLINE